MSTINGIPYSSPRNINLKGVSSSKGSALRFGQTSSANPFDSTSYGLYVNASGSLIFSSAGSSTTLGSGGGGGAVPSWETLYTNDSTFTITSGSFTIAGNSASSSDVLVLTADGGTSGDVIQISNGGTGNDIQGTSNTWKVTAAGVATFAGISISGTSSAIVSTGAAVWTLKDNDSASLSFDASGSTGLLVFDTSNGAEKIVATVRGVSIIGNSNTVSSLLVTNNTVTTFGNDADSAGVVVIRSTSLTTGAVLQLQTTEATLNGGYYLVARSATVGNKFTIGEGGVTVIAGVAGSNSFTLSAGDAVLSDGSLTMTDADDGASLSITNDTATTASVFVFAGSGAFTGTTTSSFMTITASGLTSGTAVYIPVAAMTSGTAISVVAATANFTTNGKLLSLDSTAAVAGNHLSIVTTGAYTGTGMLIMSAGAMTTGVMVSLTSTTGLTSGSLIRATTSTAGAIATNGAISLRATGAYTSTSNVGFVDILASATTAGTVVRIAASAAGQTATELLRVAASGYTTGYTGNVANFVGCSTTGAANVVAISSANSTAGTALSITANSLTTGSAVLVTSSGTITSSGEGLVNLVASGATSGDALKIDLTEGTLTSGHYINCYDDTGTVSVFSVGKAGVVLHRDFTEVVTGTNVITAAESGSVFFLSSAVEFVSTLPAPAAGLHFTFIVSAAPSGASYTIVSASGTDNIHGVAVSAADAGGSVDSTAGTAADTITFVDGQALKGDYVEVWCDGTSWYAFGACSDEDAITFTAT